MTEQRTQGWHDERLGLLTASRAKDIMAFSTKDKKTPLAARQNYLAEKVVELLTGMPVVTPTVPAMQHGIDCEPLARSDYEMVTGEIVDQAPFVVHPSVPYVGCSPDGLVGDDGLIEIKCPFSMAVHLETVRAKQMPEEHTPQIQFQLWVTDRKWCDFVSYDPRFPEPHRRFIQRIERDPKYIERLAEASASLWVEIQQALNDLGGNRSEYPPVSPVAAA
jgi:putative phage-type endonuclease